MTTVHSATLAVELPRDDPHRGADIAAAAFLTRYSARTLEAYRYDLRSYFQWATDVGLAVMEATRPHIELYRAALEARGLAPATIDRRLSTVCGFNRFAHIDGRIGANPAQYVRRPTVPPLIVGGSIAPSSGDSSLPPSASTTTMGPSQSSSA
ncbi:MAG: tyrosine-type recombinase/integrase [Acidimicrobiales bacterium]